MCVSPILGLLGGVLTEQHHVDVVDDGVDDERVGRADVQGGEEDEVVGQGTKLGGVPAARQVRLRGREGEREGGREGGRERGREGGSDRVIEGVMEGA